MPKQPNKVQVAVLKEHVCLPVSLCKANRNVTFTETRLKHPRVKSFALTPQTYKTLATSINKPDSIALTLYHASKRASKSRVDVIYLAKPDRATVIHEAVHVGQSILRILNKHGLKWTKYNSEELVAYCAEQYAEDLIKQWKVRG